MTSGPNVQSVKLKQIHTQTSEDTLNSILQWLKLAKLLNQLYMATDSATLQRNLFRAPWTDLKGERNARQSIYLMQAQLQY